jgi:tetratricopeptide (TPR) repeat protein
LIIEGFTEGLHVTAAQSDIKSIFGRVRAMASAVERAEYLQQACAGDPALRAEIESLLNAEQDAGSFLRERDLSPAATVDQPLSERPGTVIGPYKLLEKIGEGGFGVVFLAEQHEPIRRRVALKVLKPGMDTRQVIARFEAERQALAIMDHPNIARVFDGGAAPTGRPYFVMEYVKGVPITEFCDDQKLSPRQRLELFIPVCQAIQHAHQKGVIHRDLKPSNILVSRHDTTPVVKVIDFGVAKALGQDLTDKTLFTGVAQIIGTPLYMSPEQAGMSDLDVDTRSDIYSLGVLLYELLTGSTPFAKEKFRKAAYDEIRRIIRDEEPPKPSTRLSESKDALPLISAQRQTEPAKLTKLVRGELDWIVMKCLEKDRNRRYETANGVAKDIERYLADETVLACPPSAGYRLKKFARRNRGRLTAAAVLSAALLVAVGAAAWSIGWVAHERAERESRLSGQVELILDDVNRLEKDQKWRDAQAALERAEAVLAGGDAKDTIQERVRDSQRDLAFLAELDRIRQEHATTLNGRLNFEGASRHYTRAFREYGIDVDALSAGEAVARLKRKPSLIPPLSASLDDWADASRAMGKNDLRFKTLVGAARDLDPDPLRDRLRAVWGSRVTPESQSELRQLAQSIDVKAQGPTTLLLLVAALTGAELPDVALRIAEQSQFLHADDFWLNMELAALYGERKEYTQQQVYCSIAVSLRPDSAVARNNLGLALEHLGKNIEAIACYEKAIEQDPKYALARNNLGALYLEQQELDKAAACFRKAMDLDPKGSFILSNLGIVFTRQRKFDEAIAIYQRAIDLNPKDVKARHNLALAYLKSNKPNEALACCRKVVEIDPKCAAAHCDIGSIMYDRGQLNEAVACFKKAIEADPKFTLAYANLGNTRRDQGKLDEAVRCYRKAIELDPTDSNANAGLGVVFLDKREFDQAIPYFEKAIELDPSSVECHNNLGYALLNVGRLDDAIPYLKKAIDLDPKHLYALDNLGLVYLRQAKFDDAVTWFRKAIELKPDFAEGRTNLGVALAEQKKLDEAIACYRKAIEFDSKYAYVHHVLGLALHERGKLDEAIAENCAAIRLDPKDTRPRQWLVNVLTPLGRLDELRAAWEQALSANPPEHEAWFGYAELCLFLNDEDAYRRDRAALLKRFGATGNAAIAERTARACLLLPASGDELKKATALADQAVRVGKDSPNFRYYAIAKALADYRQDQFESSLKWGQTSGAEGTCPTLLILAMAHQRLGHSDQARQFFDEAIKTYEWKTVNNEWGGISHALRREAEALLKVESGVKEPVTNKRLK